MSDESSTFVAGALARRRNFVCWRGRLWRAPIGTSAQRDNGYRGRKHCTRNEQRRWYRIPVDTGSQPPGFVVAPVGVFPGVVDELVRATAVYVNAMCCSSLNESPMDHDCSQEELWVALVSMPRLACLARVAAQDPTVSSGIQRFAIEARKTAACWAEQCAVSGLSNGSNCKPLAERIPSPTLANSRVRRFA